MRKFLQFGLIGVAVYGVYRLLQLKNVSDLVTVRLVKPRIHKVDTGGLVFQTEVAINNPSRDVITITKPVVTLTSSGKMLSQSDGANLSYQIAPLSVTLIDTISLTLGWASVAGMVAGIIRRIPEIIAATRQGGDITANVTKAIGIPLEITFSTYANGIFFQSPSEKLS
ncbi:MAG: hypothetical protein ACK5XN_09265 [Bacteroidota bacterium]